MQRKSRLGVVVTLTVAALAIVPKARAQGGFHGPGRYTILSETSGKAIELDRNDRTTVLQSSSHGRDDQSWDIRPAEPGFWYIRNTMARAALEVMSMANGTPVRGAPFSGGASQQWRIAAGRDGTALITSRLGKAVRVQAAGLDGARVQTYEVSGDVNQRFRFRRIIPRSYR